VVVSSIITPTWTTEPKAVASDIVFLNIDDTDSGSDGAHSPKKAVAAPMASPESDKLPVVTVVSDTNDKGAKNSLSKLKSKLVKRSQSEKKERRMSRPIR